MVIPEPYDTPDVTMKQLSRMFGQYAVMDFLMRGITIVVRGYLIQNRRYCGYVLVIADVTRSGIFTLRRWDIPPDSTLEFKNNVIEAAARNAVQHVMDEMRTDAVENSVAA